MKPYLLPAICLCLGACAPSGGNPEPPQQKKPQAQYIGQIASLHLDQGFVLIRHSPGAEVTAGTILISQGPDGQAANLRVSGESLGQMLAADVQSGTPQLGDAVREAMIEEEDLSPENPENKSQSTDNQ